MNIRIFVVLMAVVGYSTTAFSQYQPASFAYVLQAEALGKSQGAAAARLASSGRDWIIIDALYGEGEPWTKESIATMRANQPDRKILAYISIGEAEDYRPYWRKEWSGAERPVWLGVENPDWKGNFRVNYWNPEWQKLILVAVDSAMTSGFDGVYLDIVDGFETYEQDGEDFITDRPNPATGQSYRRDMVDWVKQVATRARAKNPAALVLPQNGSQLLGHSDFVQAISGIGVEDLYTEGNKIQSRDHTNEVVENLRFAAGKPVLVIEYPKSPERVKMVEKLVGERGFTWLITDRDLKTLGTSGR